jgi:hypothetical protein
MNGPESFEIQIQIQIQIQIHDRDEIAIGPRGYLGTVDDVTAGSRVHAGLRPTSEYSTSTSKCTCTLSFGYIGVYVICRMILGQGPQYRHAPQRS